MDERPMSPVTCHDILAGHTCQGVNGECVRRGYHECVCMQGAMRWSYTVPYERWGEYPTIGTEPDPEWLAWQTWRRRAVEFVADAWPLLLALVWWLVFR